MDLSFRKDGTQDQFRSNTWQFWREVLLKDYDGSKPDSPVFQTAGEIARAAEDMIQMIELLPCGKVALQDVLQCLRQRL